VVERTGIFSEAAGGVPSAYKERSKSYYSKHVLPKNKRTRSAEKKGALFTEGEPASSTKKKKVITGYMEVYVLLQKGVKDRSKGSCRDKGGALHKQRRQENGTRE